VLLKHHYLKCLRKNEPDHNPLSGLMQPVSRNKMTNEMTYNGVRPHKEVVMGRIKKYGLIGLIVSILMIAPLVTPVAAQQSIYLHKPSAGEMFVDFFFMRPAGLIATTAGSVGFVLSLPFSALGGNIGDAGQALVVKPARFTFTRPLGEVRTSKIQ
jgi:hypothetical protein